MVGCGGSTSFFRRRPSFLVRSTGKERERDREAVLIRDANFLLTDVNMRGHAEDRVYVSLVPRAREEGEKKREEERARARALSSPLIVLDLINTFAEYTVEKCY